MIRRPLVIIAAIVAAAVAACSSPTDSSTGPSTAAAPGATTSSTPAGTSAARGGTAEQDLARFIAEARKADELLGRAAELINAGVGDDAIRVDQATADAVRAAAPDAAARAMPLGLDQELLRRALVVYNDLAARHASMAFFGYAPRTYAIADEGQAMLRCLANGGRAAARFDADLAALQSLARTSPAATTAASQLEAELAVRLSRIDSRNGCSYECGSNVYTDLAPLTWTLKPTAAAAGRGELEGITFTATPQAGGWAVASDAC